MSTRRTISVRRAAGRNLPVGRTFLSVSPRQTGMSVLLLGRLVSAARLKPVPYLCRTCTYRISAVSGQGFDFSRSIGPATPQHGLTEGQPHPCGGTKEFEFLSVSGRLLAGMSMISNVAACSVRPSTTGNGPPAYFTLSCCL